MNLANNLNIVCAGHTVKIYNIKIIGKNLKTLDSHSKLRNLKFFHKG